jgi:hypothetical protein
MLKIASKALCIVPLKSNSCRCTGIKNCSGNRSFGTPSIPHSGKSASEAQKKVSISEVKGEIRVEKRGEDSAEIRKIVGIFKEYQQY